MEKINIALNIDRNFVQHCASAINSIILSYNAENKIHFYIIHNDLTEQDKNDLKTLIPKTKFKLDFIKTDLDMFSDMPIGGHTISSNITQSTYFRLALARLLPDNISR